MKNVQKKAAMKWNFVREYSFIGLAIDSPSRIASQILPYSSSNIALPAVSRVMLSASRIGTPEVIKVPKVRVVRARMFFSTKAPKIGILSMNRSQPMRPGLNLRISLTTATMEIGMTGIRTSNSPSSWKC